MACILWKAQHCFREMVNIFTLLLPWLLLNFYIPINGFSLRCKFKLGFQLRKINRSLSVNEGMRVFIQIFAVLVGRNLVDCNGIYYKYLPHIFICNETTDTNFLLLRLFSISPPSLQLNNFMNKYLLQFVVVLSSFLLMTEIKLPF